MAAKTDKINGRITKQPVSAEITKPTIAVIGFGLKTPISDNTKPTPQTIHPKNGSQPRKIPSTEMTSPAIPTPLEAIGSGEKITF
ncbi:hypothetical protein [Echinicola salinicaeni]|uniref:hypothetical protein n=1 Tax=Echinicola salinicaeni TaxID=2762757 RepID=UPI001645D558|nr:hypothetical protein [Echinicola salinicaeni]